MTNGRPILRGAMILAGLACFAATAEAQPATIQYRLSPEAQFTRGCYPPCLCPIALFGIRGGFELTYDRSDPLFDHYRVTNVEWVVSLGGEEVRVVGSGFYRIGGEFALTHQLVLKLMIGDQLPQKFDSGLIVGGSEFPNVNITVSINRMFCFDTVIDIRSAPVREDP